MVNLDGELNLDIQMEHLKSVASVVVTSSGVLVCDLITGFHRISHQGEYLAQISDVTFGDVSLYHDKIYAIELISCQVYVFVEEASGMWVQEGMFSLELPHAQSIRGDKMCIANSHIYISSSEKHNLQVFSMTGTFLFESGMIGSGDVSKSRWPYVCDVDSDGCVYVCDVGNHRVKTFQPQTGDWREVVQVRDPMQAVLGRGCMWVATGYPLNLYKYQQVR